VQEIWPPKDPSSYADESGPQLLGESAFTYGTGLNPSLQPSNTAKLRTSTRHENRSSYPPYHPAYNQPPEDSESDHDYNDPPSNFSNSAATFFRDTLSFGGANDAVNSDEDEYPERTQRSVRVRRGSEGWEVKQMSREEIVQNYMRSRGLEEDKLGRLSAPDRYRRYVPEPPSDSESSSRG
jgi:palmitoyltransferase ZDHHC6